ELGVLARQVSPDLGVAEVGRPLKDSFLKERAAGDLGAVEVRHAFLAEELRPAAEQLARDFARKEIGLSLEPRRIASSGRSELQVRHVRGLHVERALERTPQETHPPFECGVGQRYGGVKDAILETDLT